MKSLWVAAVLAACIAAPAVPAAAQVGATFVLRSGDTVTGSLVDMNARGIIADVSGGERSWPVSSVAVIAFTGGGKNFPADEVNKVTNGRHVLALRNGSNIVGQLTDIGGKNPLRITFESSGGSRDYTSNEVARIYFAKPPGNMTSTGTGVTSNAGGIQVPANGGWVNTGIMVTKGQTVNISSSGQVQLSTDSSDVAGPAGSKLGHTAPSGAPLPGTLTGALVGRIGTGQAFGIGNQSSFPAPASGMLFLAVNDNYTADNSGAFGVTVNPLPYRSR